MSEGVTSMNLGKLNYFTSVALSFLYQYTEGHWPGQNLHLKISVTIVQLPSHFIALIAGQTPTEEFHVGGWSPPFEG